MGSEVRASTLGSLMTVFVGKATPTFAVDVAGPSLGFESITGLNLAKGLTPPVGATFAIISPSAQAVRWRNDGVDPTGSVGIPLAALGTLRYGGSLSAIKFIEQAASATLNVSYY